MRGDATRQNVFVVPPGLITDSIDSEFLSEEMVTCISQMFEASEEGARHYLPPVADLDSAAEPWKAMLLTFVRRLAVLGSAREYGNISHITISDRNAILHAFADVAQRIGGMDAHFWSMRIEELNGCIVADAGDAQDKVPTPRKEACYTLRILLVVDNGFGCERAVVTTHQGCWKEEV